MLRDHELVLEWIKADAAAVARGTVHPKPMPVKLERFRGIRDTLARAGHVKRTPDGRWVPA